MVQKDIVNKQFVEGEIPPSKVEFPKLKDLPLLTLREGSFSPKPFHVGVVFSGGQASGGHNVIAGLYDALKEIHPESRLIGFLGGPKGIIMNKSIPLTEEKIAPYRDQGGFDLIGSGRDKIEKEEDFLAVEETIRKHKLDGLVIIGGDDSNTNAAILASRVSCTVVGVPKTIDGDLSNQWVETSFGFDTASKTYSHTIGSVARDALSAGKYYFFIKLMGRSASHITLECALQTHPNLAFISEEIKAKKYTLDDIVNQIVQMIEERKKLGKNYGVILIPEGLIEFIPFNHLPKEIQDQLQNDLDPHGNVQVSKIEIERLLIDLVSRKTKISAQPLFLGYEGRSCQPSNFDANYCYALGTVAALLVAHGKTGYMAALKGLNKPAHAWEPLGVPLVPLMDYEMRKGKRKPVITKTLVDLEGPVFKAFANERKKWETEDDYRYPGPIQFFGPEEVTERVTKTLEIKGRD